MKPHDCVSHQLHMPIALKRRGFAMRAVSAPSIGGVRQGLSHYDTCGERIMEPGTLNRIKPIVAPLAWTEGQICPCSCGHIQAIAAISANGNIIYTIPRGRRLALKRGSRSSVMGNSVWVSVDSSRSFGRHKYLFAEQGMGPLFGLGYWDGIGCKASRH